MRVVDAGVATALPGAVAVRRGARVWSSAGKPGRISLNPGRNRQLRVLELAQRFGFMVPADEVHQLLHYGPSPPLAVLDNSVAGCVISLGSFSKILAPGLRLGWNNAAPLIISRFVDAGVAFSGGGLNTLPLLWRTRRWHRACSIRTSLPAALGAGVAYRPGTAFLSTGAFSDALRISISLCETKELVGGVRRLGTAIHAHLPGN